MNYSLNMNTADRGEGYTQSPASFRLDTGAGCKFLRARIKIPAPLEISFPPTLEPPPMRKRVCQWCCRLFPVPVFGGRRNRRFCTEICRKRAERARARARQRNHPTEDDHHGQ